MELCFECYCENRLADTGIKELWEACGMVSGDFYACFDNDDDLALQSTEYCITKVEDDFLTLSPRDACDLCLKPQLEPLRHMWESIKDRGDI